LDASPAGAAEIALATGRPLTGAKATSSAWRPTDTTLAGGDRTAAGAPNAEFGAARLTGAKRLTQAVVDVALVAGAANLANLLDLRPGRAIKAAAVPAAVLAAGAGDGSELAAGALSAILATAPDDLGERVMLGDSGANALGAAVGVAAARSLSPARRALAAAAVAGLILISEKVSFTRVVAQIPALAWLDALGRSR
jgi:hypothetical protein